MLDLIEVLIGGFAQRDERTDAPLDRLDRGPYDALHFGDITADVIENLILGGREIEFLQDDALSDHSKFSQRAMSPGRLGCAPRCR